VHLIRSQLHRNCAHLLVDVVLAKPLGKRRELALDIGRLLRLQLRRAELMITLTVTRGTRRDSACGIPGKSQANGGIVFAKGMHGLKTLPDKGRQPVAAAREISPDIGRVLRRQRLRNAPNLLADYLYLWEITVVRQAIETATISVSSGGDFVELLIPAASTCRDVGPKDVEIAVEGMSKHTNFDTRREPTEKPASSDRMGKKQHEHRVDQNASRDHQPLRPD
jgi:hypothetical protein